MIEELKDIVNGIIISKLRSIPKNTKIRTIDFVDDVVNNVKKKKEITIDDEIEIRPSIIDMLWNMRKKNIIKFDENLITFEKISNELELLTK